MVIVGCGGELVVISLFHQCYTHEWFPLLTPLMQFVPNGVSYGGLLMVSLQIERSGVCCVLIVDASFLRRR